MKLTLFLTLLLILLILPLASPQAQGSNAHKGKGSKGKGRDLNKTYIPPSIRKCMDVHCEAGFFCLNGRCKKIDYGCANMKCEKGYRCNKGLCVKQAHQPKKQICKPLGFEQKKMNCGSQQQKRCTENSGIVGVCAFLGNGVFQDFQSQCVLCSLSPSTRFFFKGQCSKGPKVCAASQECLNGACIPIFNESVFQNYRTCNKNQDCKVHERCAGHKCVDKRDMFNYLQSKAEADQMGVTA